VEVVNAVDTDPWRSAVRTAWTAEDEPSLEKLARTVDVTTQPASFLVLVAQDLRRKSGAISLDLVRRTRQAYPGDVWANHELAWALMERGRYAEAVIYYTAALALLPDNPGVYLNRALALEKAGLLDEAIADLHRARALAPQYAGVHVNL